MNWFDEWMSVLRDPKSEKFKGGLEDIKNPNARCCLGHLCHVFHKRGTIGRLAAFGSVRYDGDSLGLPPQIQEMTGLTHSGEFANSFLADINDNTELTPAEIADKIEKLRDSGAFGKLNYDF